MRGRRLSRGRPLASRPARGYAAGPPFPPRKPILVASAVSPAAASSGGARVWTVKAVLESSAAFLKGKDAESPRLEAEILLAHVLGLNRIQLYVRFAQPLNDAERGRMRDLIRRRAAAEPVAYLVGHKEFFSHRFAVSPAVLVPRPATETLVMEALDAGKPHAAPRVLDLCTGSGCVAVCVAKGLRDSTVWATDLSDDALAVAKRNVQTHGLEDRITLAGGDLYEAVPTGEPAFDLVLANPPYVTEGEFAALEPTVRDHEPKAALVSGPAGTELAARIIDGAAGRLNAGGWLLQETSPGLCPRVEELTRAAGFEDVATVKDGDDLPRIVVGRKPA